MKASTINKYSKNTIPSLLLKAQTLFNEYIRLRDQNNGAFQCMACGRYKPTDQMNAGHYMSAGLHNSTRFHEDNVHGCCIKCNMYMSGNLLEYRKRLIKKIGLDKVEELEIRAKMACKLDRYTLSEIIETYKDKVKNLKLVRSNINSH